MRDTENSLRTLLETIGLSWNPACLEYFDAQGGVTTQSAAQVREAPHTRSIGRWRKFEAPLEPLRRILDSAGIALDAPEPSDLD